MTPFISGLLLTSGIVLTLGLAGGLLSLLAAVVFDGLIGRAVSTGVPLPLVAKPTAATRRGNSRPAWRRTANPWTAASTSL